ncbi:MAG: PH domain-containing protein [Nocardioidaceae bacterium]|nr:MAG: PH domain-containing protein [Nocardioidaceae bacterium]
MDSITVLRSGSSRVIGASAVAFAVVGLITLALQGSGADLARYAGGLLALAWVAYACLWRPEVEISDGGVCMRNPLRTIRIPWPAVTRIEGRYGLRLDTAYGRFSAWGAAAPRGRDRMHDIESEAAMLVRNHLEGLQRLGHLDNPRLERDSADVSWDVPLIALGVLILVVAIAGPVLA